uniref:EF-hand domain-containing protein n=1 Tax=Oryza glumipatula TaxID=40148 RepID=A0A0E0AMS0_9ORYZ
MQFDADADGRISRRELRDAMRRRGDRFKLGVVQPPPSRQERRRLASSTTTRSSTSWPRPRESDALCC